MALVGLLGLAAVGGIVYVASSVGVNYSVVAAQDVPVEVAPFSHAPYNLDNLTEGTTSAYVPITINNVDSNPHVLNLSATSVDWGDSVAFYANQAGDAYSPVSVPAGGSVVVYIRVTVGHVLSAKSFNIRCTPS